MEQHHINSLSVHTLQYNITQTHDRFRPYKTTLHKLTIGPYFTEQHCRNSPLVPTLQYDIVQTTVPAQQNNILKLAVVGCDSSVQDRTAISIFAGYYEEGATGSSETLIPTQQTYTASYTKRLRLQLISYHHLKYEGRRN